MDFTLRPVTLEDFPHMVEIINSQAREPVTLDELLRREKHRPAEDPHLRLGAFTGDGLLVGYGVTSGGTGHRPGEFSIQVRVAQPYRRQGAARALYGEVLAFARAHGAIRLESSALEDDPESLAWAQRRGFATEHHLFESTLALPDWDPSPWQAAVQEVLASGIRFTTLAAEQRDGDRVAAIRRYYEFSHRLAKDIPGMADRPDYPWELYRDVVLNDPSWKDDLLLLALDGERWVALCQLTPRPSGALYNGFTAVDRDYRGRKIALAIKVRSLELAQSTGAPYIRTNNHSVNGPMLAVNRKLGYQPLPGFYQLATTL